MGGATTTWVRIATLARWIVARAPGCAATAGATTRRGRIATGAPRTVARAPGCAATAGATPIWGWGRIACRAPRIAGPVPPPVVAHPTTNRDAVIPRCSPAPVTWTPTVARSCGTTFAWRKPSPTAACLARASPSAIRRTASGRSAAPMVAVGSAEPAPPGKPASIASVVGDVSPTAPLPGGRTRSAAPTAAEGCAESVLRARSA